MGGLPAPPPNVFGPWAGFTSTDFKGGVGLDQTAEGGANDCPWVFCIKKGMTGQTGATSEGPLLKGDKFRQTNGGPTAWGDGANDMWSGGTSGPRKMAADDSTITKGHLTGEAWKKGPRRQQIFEGVIYATPTQTQTPAQFYRH